MAYIDYAENNIYIGLYVLLESRNMGLQVMLNTTNICL